MPLVLSHLLDRDPFDYIDTEIGCLAVFDLDKTSHIKEMRENSKDLVDAEAFARMLVRYTCVPRTQLRDGRFKPAKPVLPATKISELSRNSLDSLAKVLLSKCFDQPLADTEEDSLGILVRLMRCYRLRWQDSDRAFAESLAKASGRMDRYEDINQRIRSLPISDISPLLHRPASETILPEIKEILLQMNEFSRSSSAKSSAEARKTRVLALWTLVLTVIAFMSNPPASRWTCILRAKSSHHNFPVLSGWIDATCGFKEMSRSSAGSRPFRLVSSHDSSLMLNRDRSHIGDSEEQRAIVGKSVHKVEVLPPTTAWNSPQ
jgi:hypothetical protein